MTTADKLARAVADMDAARSRRDELIRQMRDEGAPLRTIAGAAGMTAAGVAKVLNRST